MLLLQLEAYKGTCMLLSSAKKITIFSSVQLVLSRARLRLLAALESSINDHDMQTSSRTGRTRATAAASGLAAFASASNMGRSTRVNVFPVAPYRRSRAPVSRPAAREGEWALARPLPRARVRSFNRPSRQLQGVISWALAETASTATNVLVRWQ